MFVLVTSRSDSNIGNVRSKTRSLGQMSLKHCSPSRGHSFTSIVMQLYQNVCLDVISVKLEYGLCQITMADCLKPCSPYRGHSFALIIMKRYQNVYLDDISVNFEYGSCRIKN